MDGEPDGRREMAHRLPSRPAEFPV